MIVALLVIILLAIVFPEIMRLFAMVVLILVIGTAFNIAKATDVPLFDVDQKCADHLSNEQAKNYCVGIEQDAYDTVLVMWASMREVAKISCARTANTQPMWNYVYLRSCLQSDYDRHQLASPKSFKP